MQSGCKESDLTWHLKQTRDSEDSGRLLALLTLSPDAAPEGTGGRDPWGRSSALTYSLSGNARSLPLRESGEILGEIPFQPGKGKSEKAA